MGHSGVRSMIDEDGDFIFRQEEDNYLYEVWVFDKSKPPELYVVMLLVVISKDSEVLFCSSRDSNNGWVLPKWLTA